MAEALKKNVRRTGRQRLSAGSHFPIHGSTVLSRKYMMCVFSVLWCSAVANGELACEDHEDPVNLLQHGGFHGKVNLTTMVDERVVEDIDMEPVMQCLRLTTRNLQTLKYPKDAEEHFEALHKVLAPWVQLASTTKTCYKKFCGPWMENQWIETHFMSQNRSGKKSRKRLAEDFGPFVPIFMPWTDLLNADSLEYDKMIHTLRKSLRPDVAYITISQFWSGLVGRQYELSDQREIMKTIPNVLVVSAAGYGHVPIPHILRELKFLDGSVIKPMVKRDLLVSFFGNHRTDRHRLRSRMEETVKKEAKTLGVKVDMHENSREESDVWQRIAANSKVSLCPRGWGRTSYHLYEILHLGLIPIHVYYDMPWLPYPDLYHKIGFSTDLDGLPKLLKKINDMDLQELERMEERIRSLKATHFTHEGVLNQISRFMKNGGSDLQCQKLPETWQGF